MPTIPIAIGLGSNLGDRLAHLQAAVRRLRAEIQSVRCSAVYETEPMHLTDQPRFLNACCVGETKLSPRDLLCSLQGLELTAGRRPDSLRFGPRELDLDLLLYGDRIVRTPDLELPHPRMAERPFVLGPLAQIAGDWIHPGKGETIARMASRLPREGLRWHAPPEALSGFVESGAAVPKPAGE